MTLSVINIIPFVICILLFVYFLSNRTTTELGKKQKLCRYCKKKLASLDNPKKEDYATAEMLSSIISAVSKVFKKAEQMSGNCFARNEYIGENIKNLELKKDGYVVGIVNAAAVRFDGILREKSAKSIVLVTSEYYSSMIGNYGRIAASTPYVTAIPMYMEPFPKFSRTLVANMNSSSMILEAMSKSTDEMRTSLSSQIPIFLITRLLGEDIYNDLSEGLKDSKRRVLFGDIVGLKYSALGWLLYLHYVYFVMFEQLSEYDNTLTFTLPMWLERFYNGIRFIDFQESEVETILEICNSCVDGIIDVYQNQKQSNTNAEPDKGMFYEIFKDTASKLCRFVVEHQETTISSEFSAIKTPEQVYDYVLPLISELDEENFSSKIEKKRLMIGERFTARVNALLV